jgi:hypothetical protein
MGIPSCDVTAAGDKVVYTLPPRIKRVAEKTGDSSIMEALSKLPVKAKTSTTTCLSVATIHSAEKYSEDLRVLM